MTTAEHKTYMSVPEVAKYLGISPQTIYRLIRNNELPALKIGRTVRVCLQDIEQRKGDEK